MSRINDLIQEHCPHGVSFAEIGAIADCVVGGTPARGNSAYWDGGTIPWMKSGEVNKAIIAETETFITELGYESCAARLVPSGSVVVALAGQGKTRGLVARTRIPLSTNQSLCAITPNAAVDSDFLYFFMTTQYQQLRSSSSGDGSRGGLSLSAIRKYRIPVPPIEVQREIVRVLDLFQSLEAELEAELEARRTQYEHYRDSLLSFPESVGVRWVSMRDIGSFFGGLTGKTKLDFSEGNARFVSYMNIATHMAVDLGSDDFVRVEPGENQRTLNLGDVLFTGSSETAGEVAISSVVTTEPAAPLYLNSFSIGVRLSDPALLAPHFAKHLFRSSPLRHQLVRTANGVTRFNVSKERLGAVRVPMPPIDEQRRLAERLDALASLVTDLSSGLPAELRARRAQYEYYRDRLLTFDEVAA